MDKLTEKKENKLTKRDIGVRFIKAIIKAAIAYFLFSVIAMLLSSFEGFYRYQTSSTIFIAAYIIFIFGIELSRGTVFQHVFAIANSLIIVFYFAHVMSQGMINIGIAEFNLTIDLRFFLSIFVLGGILGFAKTMLQLLNWMNEKEELWLGCQMRSL